MKSLAAVAACLLALAGCDTQISSTASVSQAQLELQVADLFSVEDPSILVVAQCMGDLAARVDAIQDCTLEFGKRTAHVRVRITEVAGKQTRFVTTPFVPADRVAAILKRSLKKDGYRVDQVVCPDELLGDVGQKVICIASPSDRGGKVRAKVRSVKALKVNIDYRVLG